MLQNSRRHDQLALCTVRSAFDILNHQSVLPSSSSGASDFCSTPQGCLILDEHLDFCTRMTLSLKRYPIAVGVLNLFDTQQHAEYRTDWASAVELLRTVVRAVLSIQFLCWAKKSRCAFESTEKRGASITTFLAKMNLSLCCLLPFLVILMSNTLLFPLSLVSCLMIRSNHVPFSSNPQNSESPQSQVIHLPGSKTNSGSNSESNRQQPGRIPVRRTRDPRLYDVPQIGESFFL